MFSDTWSPVHVSVLMSRPLFASQLLGPVCRRASLTVDRSSRGQAKDDGAPGSGGGPAKHGDGDSHGGGGGGGVRWGDVLCDGAVVAYDFAMPRSDATSAVTVVLAFSEDASAAAPHRATAAGVDSDSESEQGTPPPPDAATVRVLLLSCVRRSACGFT
jgi:hypothetical protein